MKEKAYRTTPIKKKLWQNLNFSQGKVRNFNLEALQNAKALLIGGGAIGSNVALGLVRKGIGRLDIFDDDEVELKNLTRQLFSVRDIRKNKAICLAKYLSKQGFFNTMITGYPYRYQEAIEMRFDFSGLDIVICGVDNNPTRISVAKYCIEHHLPMITCGVSRDGDQMYCFIQKPNEACFGCAMPHAVNDDSYPCNLPGIIDIIQIVSGFAIYALDTVLMNRYCEWNLKTVSIDGSIPDSSLLIGKKHECLLCGENKCANIH